MIENQKYYVARRIGGGINEADIRRIATDCCCKRIERSANCNKCRSDELESGVLPGLGGGRTLVHRLPMRQWAACPSRIGHGY
jgi:hypothetical protein